VIFGGGNLPHLVAVVSLRQPAAPSARERIEQFIDEVNKRHPASVRVERIVFTDVAFTRENGLLRPNLKLDRKRIGERFLEEIQGN
jgi:long-subunit acyl-CoA synthetase (AMP-forming)